MNAVIEQHNWARFISLFSEQNRMRPTRIGVFDGPPDAMDDLWLEDGLPLAGIDLDARGERGPNIQIMLGKKAEAGGGHFTHVVNDALYVRITLSSTGSADGLEIKGGDGTTTVMQFEEKVPA